MTEERAWDPVTDLVFGTFVQWDADWFLRIARDGYDELSAAFFPLYPALVSLLGSSIVSALQSRCLPMRASGSGMSPS